MFFHGSGLSLDAGQVRVPAFWITASQWAQGCIVCIPTQTQGRVPHTWCVCVCLPPNKRRRLPWVYAPIHNLVFRSIFLRSAHTVSCPVATLGRIIKERKIQ